VRAQSFACFSFRDSLTIAASFNLPRKASVWLQYNYGMSKSTADKVAQLVCPVTVQVRPGYCVCVCACVWEERAAVPYSTPQMISAPIHLLGLAFYNSPSQSPAFYIQDVSRKYVAAASGRMARIAPAFGFGGIGNYYLRDAFRARLALESRYLTHRH
jgi:hypothetical protein